MIVLWIALAIALLGSIALFAGTLAIGGPVRAADGGAISGDGAPPSGFPISILKPLKGGDPGLEENLESFYRLEHRAFEIVFSFASRDDEAFPVARRVADRHPEIPTAFVFDAREPGRNPKVSRLRAAIAHARHPFVLVSDGDVRVEPDYLRRSAANFADPSVGLVSNPIRGEGRGRAGSIVEALHMNGFVLGGTAVVSRFLGRPCVVGKSIFLRRSALEWIGGLETVGDHLAEDFLLGDLMAAAGFRVVLSDCFVTVVSSGRPIRAFWDRQVRWARMRKRLAGAGYLAEAFASPIPWAMPVACLGGGRGVAVALGVAAWKIASDAYLHRRLRVANGGPGLPFWIVLKDVLAFGVFWSGLASDRTLWRGQPVRIGKRTLLVPGSVGNTGGVRSAAG
jgi:ceramide glucosyltransferase